MRTKQGGGRQTETDLKNHQETNGKKHGNSEGTMGDESGDHDGTKSHRMKTKGDLEIVTEQNQRKKKLKTNGKLMHWMSFLMIHV